MESAGGKCIRQSLKLNPARKVENKPLELQHFGEDCLGIGWKLGGEIGGQASDLVAFRVGFNRVFCGEQHGADQNATQDDVSEQVVVDDVEEEHAQPA